MYHWGKKSLRLKIYILLFVFIIRWPKYKEMMPKF